MPSSAKHWCFTLNNFTEDEVGNLRNVLQAGQATYLVFGREVAPGTGTPHLQGFVSFAQRKTLLSVKRILCDRVHLEIARGSPLQASDYCKKDGDFEEFGTCPRGQGKRTDWDDLRDFVVELGRRPTKRELAANFPHLYARSERIGEICEAFLPLPSLVEQGATLREWQQRLHDILVEDCSDDRIVRFIVDEVGNNGKSWLCRFLVSRLPERVQLVGVGKRDDMAYVVDPDKDIFLIDCPRSQSEFLQYSVLEMLKDRVVTSNKYGSKMKILTKVPHVVVFMNEEPNREKLSVDRYDVTHIRSI